MASDSKAAGNAVTREIESRIKQIPEHLFEVFLEIREPIDNEIPAILLKYPENFPDEHLKTVTNFAYPCKMPSDEQSEHFAFVILDSTGTLFRFGYCRRSNRESTCLCIISFYPWFEVFYKILNDLSQVIVSKSTADVEQLLSSLYNYKLFSIEEFYKNEGKEEIEINILSKNFNYTRPDPRKLPSMLSSRNFSVMVSRLGPELMLCLFSHLLFERRILFVSSKLFHLTACAYGCLNLIHPMHWQSIFLPILPASMTWTTQCSTPYIIGLHSSLFSTLKMDELGDVVIVKIDERKIESQYDDLSLFPKYLIRSMKKGIQQSSQLAGDHLARVFLRAMAFTVGNYANGFDIKNDKLDFDRERYLEPYLGSHVHTFMSAVANTQMFEQFSRYRTHAQLEREVDIDEFDLEVRNLQKLQQSKKFKTNKKIYKLLEKAASPLFEQVQNKTERIQTVINKAGQRVASEASSVRNNLTSFDINDVIKRTHNSKIHQSITTNNVRDKKSVYQSSTPDLQNENSIPYERIHSKDNLFLSEPHLINQDQISSSSASSSRSSTPELDRHKSNTLINLDTDDENLLLPSPIVLNVINTPVPPPVQRQTPQIDSKIKQLQNELQYKVQTFDGKRLDPRNEYGQEKKEIKKIVEQFDPLDDPNYFGRANKNSNGLLTSIPVSFRTEQKLPSNTYDRHPSIYETIPTNHVNNVLQNIHSIYGTPNRLNFRATVSMQQKSQENNLNTFSPSLTAPAGLFPIKTYSTISDDLESSFDPLAPSKEKNLYSNTPQSSSSGTNGSNLIDFN
ncbi:unnamed protein product [Rotaria magnacalcarata]|uniref:UDENN domain-containing protein n=1 Tax=Rotaria magnacalcarata TaxID=392030 RepID=A0A816ZK32_9BILA|nr:unnamed protein product [Rotaria magnacalcarata]CAF2046688.1 unnamed protein product [Rotaria magnacalcarata]CAF2134565.1 unnamed protein product [Rotaria magnacalcarata]CAF2210342.1 unnamed protein product [Rotaria magnacalcarata]